MQLGWTLGDIAMLQFSEKAFSIWRALLCVRECGFHSPSSIRQSRCFLGVKHPGGVRPLGIVSAFSSIHEKVRLKIVQLWAVRHSRPYFWAGVEREVLIAVNGSVNAVSTVAVVVDTWMCFETPIHTAFTRHCSPRFAVPADGHLVSVPSSSLVIVLDKCVRAFPHCPLSTSVSVDDFKMQTSALTKRIVPIAARAAAALLLSAATAANTVCKSARCIEPYGSWESSRWRACGQHGFSPSRPRLFQHACGEIAMCSVGCHKAALELTWHS